MGKYVIQIMWHLNNECNFKCRHCYIQEQKTTPVDRWPFQQKVIKSILELAEQYDIIRVGLLGGEPLLDPNIVKVISGLRQAGIGRVDISTNGSLVTEKLAKEMCDAGVKMVQVSLEGPTAELNDIVRGLNSFKSAVTGLKKLQKAGIETGIMTTVSKLNLNHIEAMVDFAHEHGARIVAFNRMLPIGQGGGRFLQSLSAQEVKAMISKVHELDKKYNSMDVSSDDPLLYVPMNNVSFTDNSFGGCGAGIGNLAICHDGTVFPCRRLPIEVGNISNSSLIDIINSDKLDCFYNRGQSLKGACGLCEHKFICGGCRAAAYAFSGDLSAEDPQCWKIAEIAGGQK